MTHLVSKQREEIYVLQKLNYSQSKIAKKIGCHQSTVSRELKRNRAGPKLGYLPDRAQKKSSLRRKKAKDKVPKWYEYQPLLDYVIDKLKSKSHYSPQQISGRLKIDYPDDFIMRVCHESIYKYIWRDKKNGGDLDQNLRQSKKKRKKRYGKKDARGIIPNRKSIDERPKEVEEKKEPGHWESDLVVGTSGAIATFVERVSKKLAAIKISHRTAKLMTKAAIKVFEPLDKELRKTNTHDNGKEIARHEEITKVVGIQVYCAHPYHSWERGLNENTNGLLRQYFPKKTDFAKVSQDEVDTVVEAINNRPRKTLNYLTPNEKFEELRLCVSE